MRTLSYWHGYRAFSESGRTDSWRRDFRIQPDYDVTVQRTGDAILIAFNEPPSGGLLAELNALHQQISRYADKPEPEMVPMPDGTLAKVVQPPEPHFKPGEDHFMLAVREPYCPIQTATQIADELEKRHRLKVLRKQAIVPDDEKKHRPKAVKAFKADSAYSRGYADGWRATS